ncbi:helix-turn-helix transcriptional regulator [Schwartzia succinivorans]|jgi:predicted DNA-binding transcriptional regulator YafY|uniref:Predicted DNA-binding transcriptional regulator YafY, contains an HTH and WYL domains n=1 Tax=Schwartzia succinivorans DSM 10502 TaxID=1123243 RepID=A0A1M4YKC5_9FIRM|nr:WYL domain-containing protein [Schwartzia succinivorans]SHF06191.1 Predicted DNA-binding transcriptional regulator YafY, contains an HTH and WYL domains [Schwartzia succinivorans DSM 10502]
MYGNDRKKLLILLILEVLQQYTDEDHHLSQQEILRILKRDYDITCDRRSVRSNVLDLIDLGYDICMDDGYYFASRDFENAELRMLIDSVLFSRHISPTQGKRLIDKLQDLGNKYFKPKVSHVIALPDLNHTDNKQVMIVVDTLNDAIEEKKKVEFTYNSYGTDFKLHPREHSPYLVSPYQMVASNGRYYLLGSIDRYQGITHFRIDRITDIKMTDIPIKPVKEVEGLENGFNLPKHMAEHTYLFCGESVPVKLKTSVSMMNDLIDWFGKDFSIIEKNDDEITVSVKCNYNAMFYWALQYGANVEVLAPKELRKELAKTIQDMNNRYKL